MNPATHINQSALISLASFICAWLYPKFICFVGVFGTLAIIFGHIALIECQQTHERGKRIAQISTLGGYFSAAAYVWFMMQAIQQAA